MSASKFLKNILSGQYVSGGPSLETTSGRLVSA